MGAATLVALAGFLPVSVGAQASVSAGGGAAIPLADFGDVADVGFQAQLGGTLPLGQAGAVVGATGFYGRNSHRLAGERSDLYGVTVLGGYRLDVARDVRVTPWVGVGGTVHAHKSESYPGLEASRRGLTLTGGGTLSKGVGRVRVFASAFYVRGLGDLGGVTFPTELVTLGGGVEIPLRID